MKGKMSKDKNLGEYSSTKIVLEYSAFRASTWVLDYSLPSLLNIVEKVGNVWINIKKKKKVKENTTRQSENWQPSDF
jgi:hypothetical protein